MNMLCETCQKIFQGIAYPEQQDDNVPILYNHQSFPGDLEQAAGSNCPICDTLWRRYIARKESNNKRMPSELSPAVQTYVSENPHEFGNRHFVTYFLSPRSRDSAHGPRVIGLNFLTNLYFGCGLGLNSGVGTAYSMFDLRPTSEIDPLVKEAISGNNRPPESSVALAKKWLEKCLTEHEKCKSITARNQHVRLPARLIEIGLPAPDMIRLWTCPKDTDPAPYPRYMTLSHCWGAAHFLTLNAETVHALESGISVSKLPRTFRDALDVANQLGIRFLWIDSLCILQDSVSDWEQEASRMADVYRGSICNIAATGAANADAGCLYPRTSPPKHCVVNATWDDELNDEYHVEDRNFWEASFESDPLRQRAWVVQELLLSPRVLHLGRAQFFWECYQSKNCELYPAGLPRSIHNEPKVPLEEMTQPQQNKSSFLTAHWMPLVHKYTSCKLTMPEDKLVALSGIVKILQQSTRDEYYAGLWKTDLPAQLLWKAAWDQTGPLMPAKEYRAPSWSWASVDGRIWVSTNGVEDVLVNIIEVVVKAVTRDLTGRIASGFLRLPGQLSTAEVHKASFGEWLPIDFYSIRFNGQNWAPLYSLDRSSFEPPHNLHCLAIGGNGKVQVNCLLLVPTMARKGEFRRWGSMTIMGNQKVRCFEDSIPHPWLQYESFDGKKTYTISII